MDNNNGEKNKNHPPKKDFSPRTDKSDLNHLNNKSNNNMSQKDKTMKTQENIKLCKILKNEQINKQKKLIHKIKSFSNKNLKKNEFPLKKNKHLVSKDRLTFADYLSTELEDMKFHDVALIDKRLFFD